MRGEIVYGTAVLALSLSTLAVPAFGQTSPARKEAPVTSAEVLFRQAGDLMTAGRFEEACPILAESFRLDPAGGTLQNLAVCYESAGRVASAYARYQALRALSLGASPPRMDRVKLADAHIAKLAPQLSRVRVSVAEGARAKGMVVSVDSVDYEEAAWSLGLLVDPGPHTVVVRVAAEKRLETRVLVARGADVTVDVTNPAASNDGPRPAPRARTAEPAGAPVLGYVLGAAGLAALGTGAVFGALAIAKNNDGNDRCSAAKNPNDTVDFDKSGNCFVGTAPWQKATDAKNTAMTYANVANVLVPVGAISAGIGLYIVVRARGRDGQTSARLVPVPFGGMLEGTF